MYTVQAQNLSEDQGGRNPRIIAQSYSKLAAEWSTLNHLRTGIGRFNYCLSKWGLRSSSSCSCGPIDQTADHVIVCPLNPAPSGKRGLMQLDEPTRRWLKELPSF